MYLQAQVERQVYYDSESSFGVYDVKELSTGKIQSLVGVLPDLLPGEIVEGEVIEQTRYNPYMKENELQWKAQGSMLPTLPVTEHAIEQFIAGGFAQNVGPFVASNLVRHYGEDTLNILGSLEDSVLAVFSEEIDTDNLHAFQDAVAKWGKKKSGKTVLQPLLDVPGVGPKTAAYLIAGWIHNKAKRDVMLFLYNCRLTSSMAGKVIKKLGFSAPDILRENPYVLLEIIPSLPFSIPDKIARAHGMAANDIRRIEALITHVSNILTWNAGHVCVPKTILHEASCNFADKMRWTINAEDLSRGLDAMIESKSLIEQEAENKQYIYTPTFFQCETESAEKLCSLMTSNHTFVTIPKERIKILLEEWSRKTNITLDESQKKAVYLCLKNPVCILTGGPGTGKTTLLNAIKHILRHSGHTYTECAPTGKAARNMSQQAQTIHRLLQLRPDSDLPDMYTSHEDIDSDVVFVDESSMVDIQLFSSLLQSISVGTHIVFVGDADQLPSVGPGAVLQHMLSSQKIPCAVLDTVHRQKYGGIIENANIIRTIQPYTSSPIQKLHYTSTMTPDSEFALRTARNDAQIVSEIDSAIGILYQQGFDPLRDIQVMAPMRKGDAGIYALNAHLQSLLNPNIRISGKNFQTMHFGQKVLWAEQDRIMNVKNDYDNEVFNGEIGFISQVDSKEKTILVNYPDINTCVTYARENLDSLLHAYAITIHKSQGSEYPCVIMALPRAAYRMMFKNLVYTGVTRARKKCMIVGDPGSISKALTNIRQNTRCSLLSYNLCQCFPNEISLDLG